MNFLQRINFIKTVDKNIINQDILTVLSSATENFSTMPKIIRNYAIDIINQTIN